MTKEPALKILADTQEKLWSLGAAMGLISHDGNTVAPKDAYIPRGHIAAALSEQYYLVETAPEFGEALDTLDGIKDTLDEKTARQVYLYKRSRRESERIPMDEYVEFNRLLNDSAAVWHEAKEKSDFPMFAPYLEKTVDTLIRFAGYTDPDKKPYDVCLDKFESGLTVEKCEEFFGAVAPAVKKLITRVCNAPKPDTSFMREYFPVEKQVKLADRIAEIMLIDRSRFAYALTEHPYTTDCSKYDVRVATHYAETDFGSALFANIHECGHSLYELHIADDLQFTVLGGGVSMGIHESQSRFYENIIGRSKAFSELLLPELRAIAPSQFRGVTADMLWRAVCDSKPSLIRTEADELTYTMHILIRYELEKKLMDRSIRVKELPECWNTLYREYLGVEVPDDRHGVLQDSHWSGGAIGYFPSYALGSAYGAQMLSAMKQSFNVDTAVANGDFTQINGWLEDRIWKYGSLIEPSVLLEKAVGQPFSPQHFIDYLTEKYTELY